MIMPGRSTEGPDDDLWSSGSSASPTTSKGLQNNGDEACRDDNFWVILGSPAVAALDDDLWGFLLHEDTNKVIRVSAREKGCALGRDFLSAETLHRTCPAGRLFGE